jgi:predicted CopG family antitoxin
MVRISITEEAYEAICATLPLGSVAVEPRVDGEGVRMIWLDPAVIDRLRAMRGPGDSYSDVILRLAKAESQ